MTPVNYLTPTQRANYSRYTAGPTSEELARFFYLTKGHVLSNCMSQVLADMFRELQKVELEGIKTDEYEEGFWDAVEKVRERLLRYRADNKVL